MDWTEFINLLPWGVLGGISYWLIKLTNAYNRKDFSINIFFKKNLLNLILGLFSLIVLIALYAEHALGFLEGTKFDKPILISLLLGANGAMVLKAILTGGKAAIQIALDKFFKK